VAGHDATIARTRRRLPATTRRVARRCHATLGTHRAASGAEQLLVRNRGSANGRAARRGRFLFSPPTPRPTRPV
jgi:hypothetical protein